MDLPVFHIDEKTKKISFTVDQSKEDFVKELQEGLNDTATVSVTVGDDGQSLGVTISFHF